MKELSRDWLRRMETIVFQQVRPCVIDFSGQSTNLFFPFENNERHLHWFRLGQWIKHRWTTHDSVGFFCYRTAVSYFLDEMALYNAGQYQQTSKFELIPIFLIDRFLQADTKRRNLFTLNENQQPTVTFLLRSASLPISFSCIEPESNRCLLFSSTYSNKLLDLSRIYTFSNNVNTNKDSQPRVVNFLVDNDLFYRKRSY